MILSTVRYKVLQYSTKVVQYYSGTLPQWYNTPVVQYHSGKVLQWENTTVESDLIVLMQRFAYANNGSTNTTKVIAFLALSLRSKNRECLNYHTFMISDRTVLYCTVL